ncbi:hypothetical protein Tco_0867963 [Tanacetum coccineum]
MSNPCYYLMKKWFRKVIIKISVCAGREMNEDVQHMTGLRLVPSCCVIFDLEPLSLSFDFVFSSEIFKSFSFLLTISLDRLDILKEDIVYQSLQKSLSSSLSFLDSWILMPIVQFKRTSLTGFPAQSVRSSNADALDSLYLLVLNTGTSQSRQHGKSESNSYYLSDYVINSFTGTSLIHIESHHRWNLRCHLPRACLMLAQAGFPYLL